MKKQTGIWLDLRNAWIFDLPTGHDGEIVAKHIFSEIEENAVNGGTRRRTQWGSRGGHNEHSIEERHHHEEKEFFEKIISNLDPETKELIIFGPSEAKYGFENLLQEQHQFPKIMGVESADQMTEHQMEAWVRAFFHHVAPRKISKSGQ